MANIELNKPLYKAEGDKNFTPPLPRQPKPSILARAAALFLDIMLLHLVLGVIVRYVPQIPLALGGFAPWVGLLIGFLYFGIGFSHITLGRTLGKLILRVQVCELQGPDLSVGRAFLRAAVLMWPLPVLLILNMTAEKHQLDDTLTLWSVVDIPGILLIVGWVLGSFAYTALEPYNRAVHDRVARSIIINAELEPEPVAEYLAGARAVSSAPPRAVSMVALGSGIMLCLAYGVVSLNSFNKEMKKLSPETLDMVRGYAIEGFGRPLPWAPRQEEESTSTLAVAFHYRKRTPIDIEALKNDAQTTKALDVLIRNRTGEDFTKDFQEYMYSANQSRARRGQTPMDIPEKITFELSFVELADLYFARESHAVYTLSKTIDMPTTVIESLKTTATAQADLTTTASQ